MKTRILSLVLVLLVSVSFSGCAEAECDALGSFLCTSAQYKEMSVDPNELYGGETFLELNEDGKGYFHQGQDSGAITWRLDGSDLRITFKNKDCKGTYENERISIDLLGSGVVLTFEKEVSDVEPSDLSMTQSYYGWWKIGDASESWSLYSGAWVDCFAVINVDEQGRGELVLWDEDSSADKPIGRIDIEVDENGLFTTVKGAFMHSYIAEGNWGFDYGTDFEDMLICELAYFADGGSFNAVFYLRPWGLLWDDVKENAPDLLPYHYETWYLPLLEAGSSMPGHFEEIR